MPAASHKSTVAATGKSTSPAATIGAAAAGDTKVLALFARAASDTITLSATPSGYTQRQAWTHWDDGDSYVAVYSKAVTTTESSASVGFTLSGTAPWALAAFVVTGDWDAISTEAGSRIGYGTNATVPAVTAGEANTVLLNAVCAVDWRQFLPPAGMSETNDIDDDSLEISIATGYEAISASGTTGTRVWQFRDIENPNSNLAAVGRGVAFTIKGTTTGETNALLAADVVFPSGAYSYATTALAASPTSISVPTGAGAVTLTVNDQNGVPVEGATLATTSVSIATVPAVTNAAGQAMVTFGTAGVATITATYDDGMSSLTTTTVPVTVTSLGLVAPVIRNTELPIATVGAAYFVAIELDGSAPITLSIAFGSLPPGLTLVTGSGVDGLIRQENGDALLQENGDDLMLDAGTYCITGVPTAGGGFPFTLRASNAFGLVDRPLSIGVLGTDEIPATDVNSPWTRFLKAR